MKVIGLTGSIGSGKSTVLSILEEMNIPCIDSDKISHELMKKGNRGYLKILESFGYEIINSQGEIDRKKMASLIFSNIEKKEKLEHILHPYIQEEVKSFIQKYQEESYVVVEAPLLFEIGWESFFTEIWTIVCKEEILLERLQQFRGISKEDAKNRLQYQLNQEIKKERADVVLYNDLDKNYLKQQILEALKR